MFQGELQVVLVVVGQGIGSIRGVCGVVWGSNDIVYRCWICEYDFICVICVLCFQNGNYVIYDYFMICIGGGCCDCGDVIVWK